MKAALRIVCALGLATALPACEGSYVEGRVTDVRGAALPGVIVRAVDTPSQDLTDGLGRYKLAAAPGAVRVAYSKTGYASIERTLEASSRKGAEVSLWPLPIDPGIYIVENFRFIDTTRVVPKQYFLKDGTAAFGALFPEVVHDAASEPFILAYRTTRYNARLSRLVPAEAQSSGDANPVTVWVEAGAMAVALEPLEGQTGPLYQLQVGRPLDPGVYGVHWGAMSGYTTLDTRVFLFRVPEPPAAEGEAAVTTPATVAGEPKEIDVAPTDTAGKKKAELPVQEPIEPIEESAAPPTNP